MNSNNRNINGKSSGNSEWNDSSISFEDYALLQKIGRYLKGELDTEEVKNDPGYEAINRNVKSMLSDHQFDTGNEMNRRFIIEAMAAKTDEEKIKEEIREVKQEISHKKLNEISSDWVKEWHEKKQGNGKKDPKKEAMREYISDSLEQDAVVRTTEPDAGKKSGLRRSLVIRYISLAAAVITGAVIVITALVNDSDPGKLYNRYYESIEAVSPVTRSLTSNETDVWTTAVNNFNNGNYQTASTGFSEIISLNTLSTQPRFYLGICHLAMGDYSQAVTLFNVVVNEHGEFAREAEWYLGLAYLKLGNTEAASECFKELSQVQGYYSERSEEILRRLK